MINYLSEWFNNKVNLVKSREFQSYIQNFLKESLRFSDDQLHVNSYLREYLDKNIDVIDIEAMDKTARSSFQITFSRNKENFEFISTLTRFVLVGDQTWNEKMVKKMQRMIYLINNQKDNLLKKFSPNFETDLTSIESCVEIAVIT